MYIKKWPSNDIIFSSIGFTEKAIKVLKKEACLESLEGEYFYDKEFLLSITKTSPEEIKKSIQYNEQNLSSVLSEEEHYDLLKDDTHLLKINKKLYENILNKEIDTEKIIVSTINNDIEALSIALFGCLNILKLEDAKKLLKEVKKTNFTIN